MSPLLSISPTQIEQFWSDGFVVCRRVFTPMDVAAAADVLRRAAVRPVQGVRKLPVPRNDQTLLVWLSDLAAQHPECARLAFSAIGEIAAALLSTSRVTLAQDTAFVKRARSGGAVGWHQDGSYWRHAAPLEMVTAWVALTPSNAACGGVQMLPGSHDLGLLNATVLDAFSADPEAFLVRHGLTARDAITLELEPGDVAFHHALTVHGSGPNVADVDRIGYVLHCLSDRVRYRPSKARPWQREPTAPGGRFEGPKHPVLWPLDS